MTQTQNFETISPAEADGKHEKKLLDRARDALLEAGFEREAAGRYVDWMLRYILFHNKRHPLELRAVEIDQYLSGPAFAAVGGQEQRVEAARALKFLY